MRSVFLGLLRCALVLVPACGGGGSGEDLHGDYEMIEVRSETGSCEGNGTSQPIDPADQYFRLDVAEFFGVEFLGWYHCTAPMQCDADADLGASFFPDRGEWVGGFTAWGGTPCQITSVRRTIESIDDTSIHVLEQRREGEAPELDCSTATGEEIDARAETLPCTTRLDFTAERLAP